MILSERLLKLKENVVDWYSWLYYVPKETWPHEVIKSLPGNLNMFQPHEIVPILREVIVGMIEWGGAQIQPHGTLINLIQESEELLKQTAPPSV